MGRMAVFYQIDNALLLSLTSPGVTLAAKISGKFFASSSGHAMSENELKLDFYKLNVFEREIPWTGNPADSVFLHINAPIKVLFTQSELALSAASIPIFDGLILWFTLGFWLMRKARRIKALGGAVQEFSTQHQITRTLEEMLKVADGKQIDEISDVSAAIETMVQLTLLREREREEEANRRRLWATVFAQCNDAIMVTDHNNQTLAVNKAFTHITGYTQEEIVGQNPNVLASGLESPDYYEEMWQAVMQAGNWSGEIQDKRKDGTIYIKWLRISVVRDPAGIITNFIGIFQDITERKQAEEELTRSEIKFRTLYDSSSDAVMLLDRQGFLDCNKAALEMFGFPSKEEFCNKHPTDLSPKYQHGGIDSITLANRYFNRAMKEGGFRFDWLCRRLEGEEFPSEIQLSSMRLEGKVIIQATVRDITQRIRSEQEIERLAFYDSLTGLANRRLLLDRLQRALSANVRNDKHGAIIFIDLDNFKTLNDTKGHSVGDLLLIEVSRRLKNCVREEDTVARLGGDEFVLLLENLSTAHSEASANAEHVAQKVLHELNRTYLLNGHEHHSSPSIGVAMFCDYSSNVESLVKHADSAMYQAKEAGRNTVRFYDHRTQEIIDSRSEMENELRHALVKQQLKLYYQVQVAQAGQVLGAEVLLRWNHPLLGIVPPDKFIPLAEETGLIVPIGTWVLQSACEQLKQWENNPCGCDLVLAVNVSVRQFHEADFVSQVRMVIKQSGVNPARLKLEITESMFESDVQSIIAIMHELKLLGVQFSMDDFGTGYSSLSIIKRLPLNQLKIDQSFVRDIEHDVHDRAIVRTIIAMAHSMELNVIAEGVETDEQRQMLELEGCTNFQGYLFGKPVPIEEFEAFLRKV
jgi:diguanylate cyclase (GGDEF)-like protein/PAS domain S-box-containing protein